MMPRTQRVVTTLFRDKAASWRILALNYYLSLQPSRTYIYVQMHLIIALTSTLVAHYDNIIQEN